MLPHGAVPATSGHALPREPAWKGQWQDVKEGWWYVEACRQHAPKVTGWASEGF
jgi:hypothetical protein